MGPHSLSLQPITPCIAKISAAREGLKFRETQHLVCLHQLSLPCAGAGDGAVCLFSPSYVVIHFTCAAFAQPQGLTGQRGPAGIPGTNGSPGQKGEKGDQGFKGSQGTRPLQP